MFHWKYFNLQSQIIYLECTFVSKIKGLISSYLTPPPSLTYLWNALYFQKLCNRHGLLVLTDKHPASDRQTPGHIDRHLHTDTLTHKHSAILTDNHSAKLNIQTPYFIDRQTHRHIERQTLSYIDRHNHCFKNTPTPCYINKQHPSAITNKHPAILTD